MPSFITVCRRLKPWVAVAAAYVIALQIILASLFATQHTVAIASSPFVICDGGAMPSGGTPAYPEHQHPGHGPCVLCVGALAHAAPAQAQDVALPTVSSKAVSYVARWFDLATTPHPTPRLSQGPPQIA
jgi:hypothetical protein